jgi:hypothetical protein
MSVVGGLGVEWVDGMKLCNTPVYTDTMDGRYVGWGMICLITWSLREFEIGFVNEVCVRGLYTVLNLEVYVDR